MRARALLALPLVLAAAVFIPQAAAASDPAVAALQVGLHSRGLYTGPIDGIEGPGTAKAVRLLQRRARIAVDGVVGPQTRRALGRFGRHPLGTRPLRIGKTGWDVASLQFRLAAHGFPSGPFDGVFGPRGHAWHSGIDLPAPLGTPVYAARAGTVVWAGWRDGGYGFLVVVAHGSGERSMYAHLSQIDVRVGVWVGQGVRVGLVGASGHATGPHLHFEVRVRNAAVDPLRALP